MLDSDVFTQTVPKLSCRQDKGKYIAIPERWVYVYLGLLGGTMFLVLFNLVCKILSLSAS